jgi:hypothetical protein
MACRRFPRGGLVLAGLGLLAGCGVAPPGPWPEPRLLRVGWLIFGGPPYGSPFEETALRGLERLGYAEGLNLAIDYRHAEGQPDRLRVLTAQLVSLNPDGHRCKPYTPLAQAIGLAAMSTGRLWRS